MQRIDSLALAKSASHFSLEHLFLPLPLRILARRVPELSPPSKPKLYTGLLSDKCVARRSSHARQLQAHKAPPPQKKKFAKTTKTNKPPLHSLSAAPERNAAAGRPSRGPESLLARTRAPTTMQVDAPHTHAFSTSSGPEPPPLYSQAPIGKGQLRQVQRNCGRGDQLLQFLTAPLSSLSLSISATGGRRRRRRRRALSCLTAAAEQQRTYHRHYDTAFPLSQCGKPLSCTDSSALCSSSCNTSPACQIWDALAWEQRPAFATPGQCCFPCPWACTLSHTRLEGGSRAQTKQISLSQALD